MKKITFLLMVLTSIYYLPVTTVYAQTGITCGNIIEGEFWKESQGFKYTIDLAPGDRLQVSAKPVGDTLNIAMKIFTPTGKRLTGTKGDMNVSEPEKTPTLDTGVLSGRGTYTLIVANSQIWVNSVDTGLQAGTGPFTLSISCTLHDGTVVNPGDTSQPPQAPFSNPAVGFPGLSPVDFEGAFDLPMTGQPPIVAPIAGDMVFVYKLKGTVDEVYKVSIERNTGFGSFAMTVLDPANVVVFTGIMGSIDTYSIDLKITTTGTYLLGFYLAPISAETAKSENMAGVFTITVEKQESVR